MPTREDLAWLAGFWDGEGSVSGGKRPSPAFSLTQAGDEGMALCQRVLDSCGIRGAVYPQPAKSATRGNKPYWRVMINGHERVQALLAMCWPWLSETKRKQAIAVLTIYRQRKSEFQHPNRIKTHCLNGHAFDDANTRIVETAVGYKRVCRACKRAAWHRRRSTLPPGPGRGHRSDLKGARSEEASG